VVGGGLVGGYAKIILVMVENTKNDLKQKHKKELKQKHKNKVMK
jgi:predicted protein tyrosine phosphatase